MPNDSGLKIIECDDSQRGEWDAYLAGAAEASFYHRFGWKAVNESCFHHRTHFLAAHRQGAIVGVLPLVALRSRLFGRILCSMPFVNYGGPVADDAEAENALLGAAQVLVDQQRLDYLELRGIRRLRTELPTSEHKVSMTIALQPDPEALWNGFKSKHRTNIRRVYKDGFEVRHGGRELLDAFYQVICESWRSLGTPIYQRAYFERILRELGDEVRLFVVFQGAEPVAAAFNGYYKGTVEGMWLGIRPQFRHQQPSYVLYWEMIKHACEAGCRVYHLGRSTAGSEAESFKKKWNAEAKQLYWQYYLPDNRAMPSLNVDNPKYALAIQAWRRLPLALTRLIGPPLARSIP